MLVWYLVLACCMGVTTVTAQNDPPPEDCEKVNAQEAWGLDRIDQRNILENQDEASDSFQYTIGPLKGRGVTVYVVDTGIQVDHPNLGGRVEWGFTANANWANDDTNGHGTHVAGIIGSKTFGVAKLVKLVAVKVLDSKRKGTATNIKDGLSWVNDNIDADDLNVVSVSLSVPRDNSINKLITTLGKKAVVVVAAGNNDDNACLKTPASANGAIVVAAMNIRDKASKFSNWGNCVDLYGPGLKIKSTFIGGGVKVMSGTSVAAAHVAGVAALNLERKKRSSEQMRKWLIKESTKDKLDLTVSNHSKSPNRLVFLNCLVPA